MGTTIYYPAMLQLFDGDAVGEGNGSNAAPATQEQTAENQNTAPATQEDAAGSIQKTEDPEQEFKSLIKGKYKDIFQKHIQSAMDARFKANKEAESKYNSVQPILDLLGSKYGADKNDLESIYKAMEADPSYYEQDSVNTGLPIDALKQIRQLEFQNQQLQREREAHAREEEATRQYQAWVEEGEAVKEVYGEQFDLDTELADPQFLALLKAPGMTMQKAFEVMHLTELTGGAMQFAASKTAKAAADTIKARGNVATENAASGTPAVRTSVDISQLTKDQHAKINKGIEMGKIKSPDDIAKYLGKN